MSTARCIFFGMAAPFAAGRQYQAQAAVTAGSGPADSTTVAPAVKRWLGRRFFGLSGPALQKVAGAFYWGDRCADVARQRCRNQDPFDVGEREGAVDRFVNDAGLEEGNSPVAWRTAVSVLQLPRRANPKGTALSGLSHGRAAAGAADETRRGAIISTYI
jgi:hypothetical protein